MCTKKFILSFFVVVSALSAIAQKRFEFTPKAVAAYDLAMSLRFDAARKLLADIRQSEPDNLIVYHIEDYIDFFTVYINENAEEFARLEKNKNLRLAQIKTGDPNSPYFLYLQANIRLHWALARLKFEEYFTAFREVNKAFKLLTENDEKFPEFLPNKKDLGILHAMVGTIPDNYKWGVKLLTSLDGTIQQGRTEIETVLNYARKNDFIYEQETRVLYAYLLMHLDNDGQAAWQLLNNSKLSPEKNPLTCFTMANVAMRTDHNDEAIRLLKHRPKGPQYLPFHYLDFMLGNAKLRRLDKDAEVPLLRFLKNFKGRHFIKEAYQKLAWNALINGNRQKYFEYKSLCKNKGYTTVGSDKSALREANSADVPAVALLKARLLFDGGYYERAYNVLQSKAAADMPGKKNSLEFTYRMARILHKLGRHNEAFRYYHRTIETGRDEPYYFACNAALQTGLLFETLKNYAMAKKYFDDCLSISPAEHKTGLHQQAKAGLVRVESQLK